MGDHILTGVERIHFYENDKNSPEDFGLPAALTSFAGSIGRDMQLNITEDGWRQRKLYYDLLAWTGMGFGLLWKEGGCPSCMDLSQVNDTHDESIERGFDGIGCSVEIMENTPELKRKIVACIDNGLPVLAWGMVGPPECGIVCGYLDDGSALLGYDMLQASMTCEVHSNGMVLLKDWTKVWKFAFLKEKRNPVDLHSSERKLACIRHGIGVMEKNEAQGYLAGQAAYAAWKEYVLAESVPPEEVRNRHFLHHILTGNHAEARAYTGYYLREKCRLPQAHPAGGKFQEIHDTCWKIWGVLGKYNEPMEALAEKFTDPDNRQRIADLIDTMARLDGEALKLLKETK